MLYFFITSDASVTLQSVVCLYLPSLGRKCWIFEWSSFFHWFSHIQRVFGGRNWSSSCSCCHGGGASRGSALDHWLNFDKDRCFCQYMWLMFALQLRTAASQQSKLIFLDFLPCAKQNREYQASNLTQQTAWLSHWRKREEAESVSTPTKVAEQKSHQ